MKKGWQTKQIGYLCEVIAGQSPKGKFYNSEGIGMAFYQGKKDFGEKFIKAPTTWTTQTTKIAKEGDILMSVRAPVGPVNFATDEICIGRGLAAIRSGSELNRDFLFYQLLHLRPKIAGKKGAVFASINKSEIEAIPLALPPLPEQQRIVKILDQAFAAIDKAKPNVEKNIQKLDELHQSLLHNILYKDEGIWKKSTIAQSCEFWNGKAHEQYIDKHGKYIVVNSKFISSDAAIKKYTNVQMLPLYKGDIVMVMSDVPNGKALAKCYLIEEDGKYSLNQRICAIRSKSFVKKYLYYHLNRHRYLLKFDNGENQTNLRKNDILNTPLMIPPIEAQKTIALKLDQESFYIKSISVNYQKKIEILNELKQSILQKAFEGRLTMDDL